MAICFLSPIFAAIGEANHGKTGVGAYVVAIFVGLGIGAGCVWIMWKALKQFCVYLEGRPKALEKWLNIPILSAMIFWIAFADILGAVTTTALLRLVD